MLVKIVNWCNNVCLGLFNRVCDYCIVVYSVCLGCIVLFVVLVISWNWLFRLVRIFIGDKVFVCVVVSLIVSGILFKCW